MVVYGILFSGIALKQCEKLGYWFSLIIVIPELTITPNIADSRGSTGIRLYRMSYVWADIFPLIENIHMNIQQHTIITNIYSFDRLPYIYIYMLIDYLLLA